MSSNWNSPHEASDRIHVADLTFDGKQLSDNVNFWRVTDFSFTRCEFLGGSLTIQQGSTRGMVRDCRASGSPCQGFYLQSHRKEDHHPNPEPCEDITFIGCVAEGNEYGFAVTDSDRIEFLDCRAFNNVGRGGCSDGPHTGCGFCADGARQVSYVGCVSNRNMEGFHLMGPNGFTRSGGGGPFEISFTGCVAKDNLALGFVVGSSDRVSLVDCHAINNGSEDHAFGKRRGNGISLYPDLANPTSAGSAHGMTRFSVVGGSVIGNYQHGIWIGGSGCGVIEGTVIMNNSQQPAGPGVPNEHDGIHIEDHPTVAGWPGERITITGCTIGDDQPATDTDQNYAVYAEDGVTESIHAFFNTVYGNLKQCDPLDLLQDPIQVPGATADNPGSGSLCPQ